MFYADQKVAPLPLVIALRKGHYDLAEYLISIGADLDVVCKKCNKTPRELIPEEFEIKLKTITTAKE